MRIKTELIKVFSFNSEYEYLKILTTLKYHRFEKYTDYIQFKQYKNNEKKYLIFIFLFNLNDKKKNIYKILEEFIINNPEKLKE